MYSLGPTAENCVLPASKVIILSKTCFEGVFPTTKANTK